MNLLSNHAFSFNFLPSHPYNAHHLAIGDLVAWSGIKRCGAAIAMGGRAADNIFQQILFERFGIPTSLSDWPRYPPMIGLAVGKKAVVYVPDSGTTCSEENMKLYFGEDLGFQRKLWIDIGASGRFYGELTLSPRRMLGSSEA